MQFEPHSYQKQAIDFICTRRSSALFLSLGLGKTAICLAAFKRLKSKGIVSKALVVAPPKVAQNTWPNEVTKWDDFNDLRVSLVLGTPAKRLKALNADTDIYVVSRDSLKWLNEQQLPAVDMLILDELSGFKSSKTSRVQVVKKLNCRFKRCVGLTGTPLGNGYMDLFSEIGVLDGFNTLGKYITHFREAYFMPAQTRTFHQQTVVTEWKLRPGMDAVITHKLKDICLSMSAEELLDMPELIERDYPVTLSQKELCRYHELKNNWVLKAGDVGAISAANAGVLAAKLLQAATGTLYTDENKSVVHLHKRKLTALSELIEDAEEENVLVAYWFKADKERLKEAFPEGRFLETDRDMNDWNAGKLKLAFIHPASGGYGLNLQSGGHILVWFSLPWSLELYQQTCGRLYRQGQKERVVSVCRLISKGTIDEKVCRVLKNKGSVQSELLDALKAEAEE